MTMLPPRLHVKQKSIHKAEMRSEGHNYCHKNGATTSSSTRHVNYFLFFLNI